MKLAAREIHSIVDSYMLVIMMWAYNAGISYQQAVQNVAATLESEAKQYNEVASSWEKRVEQYYNKVIIEEG